MGEHPLTPNRPAVGHAYLVGTAGCEAEIGDKPCGVAAIGRCLTCGRAFCVTHQARTWRRTSQGDVVDSTYIDTCQDCLSDRDEAAKVYAAGQPARDALRIDQRETRYQAARDRLRALIAVLVLHGSPGLEP